MKIKWKEKGFLNCTLSARHGKERLSEIKCLITIIANPTSNEKDDHVNQWTHGTEDVLNELQKMKGRKAKIVNNNSSEIESCGSPQVADDPIIDEKLSNVLDKELSNFIHDKVKTQWKS